MKVSTKGRYALRVMLDLAINNTGEFIPLKEIAERQGITQKYLEHVINQLKRAGFLRSSRGTAGGYKLAYQPSEYIIGDILKALEGSLAPIACLDDEVNQCERASICATLGFWTGLNDVINEYVNSYTLQDLLDEQKNLIGGDYCI